MATVTTKCPNCGALSQTEYQQIGAPITCSTCREKVVPEIPNGAVIPYHEWDLTYKDFRQLVEDRVYRAEIEPLLGEWFGYRLIGDGPGTIIADHENKPIEPLWLHGQIQREPDKQYKLYQTAMSLWR
jgi:hypothetical protein